MKYLHHIFFRTNEKNELMQFAVLESNNKIPKIKDVTDVCAFTQQRTCLKFTGFAVISISTMLK